MSLESYGWALAALLAGAPAGAQVVKVSQGDPAPADAPSETSTRPRHSVSDDGCFVVFTSRAKSLAPGQTDGNGASDVFLYDKCRDEVVLVSHRGGAPDVAANGTSDQPVISPDGAFVAFRSTADDIVPERTAGDYGGQTNVFLWERQSDTFELASHANGVDDVPGDRDSRNAVISGAAGRPYVAFESDADNLVDNDNKAVTNVYRYQSGSGPAPVTLVSKVNAGITGEPDGGSFNPDIDGSGGCIVFESLARNLVSDDFGDDQNGALDVFRWIGTANPAIILLSHVAGAPNAGNGAKTGDSASTEPSVDDVCETFAFKSRAKDLAAAQNENNSGDDVFIARNGNVDAILASHRDGSAGVTGNDVSDSPILSRDGKWLAYASRAQDLAPGQNDGATAYDVFLYDVAKNENILVSHAASDPKTPGSELSAAPEISREGLYVAYESRAKDLDPNQNDGNGEWDVFHYYREWNRSVMVSRRFASIAIAGNRKSERPAISGDGYTVAFTSEADDLVADDPETGGLSDVFLLDVPRDLPFFTARSTSDRNLLEWITPQADYVSMRLFWGLTCPVSFAGVVIGNELFPGVPPANGQGSFAHGPLLPNLSYCYAIFLTRDNDPIGPSDLPARTIVGRPFSDILNDPTGQVKWALNLAGIAALTQSGIGTQGNVAVANDGGVYAFTRGAAGGAWPAAFWPFRMSLPAQGRPPVVNFGTVGSTRTTFVGAQDGRAYAFDADRGARAGGALWYSQVLGGSGIQAGTAGMFTMFGGAYNHLLVAARQGSAGQFHAVDPANGALRSTVGGPPIGAIGGAAAVDYANNRVYFASLEFTAGQPSLWCRNLTATGVGGPCWSPVNDPAGISGGPVQRGNRLYVGDILGQVFAFDAGTGTKLWGPYTACGATAVKGFVFPDRGGAAQDLYFSNNGALCAITDSGLSATPKWTKTYAQIPGSSTPILARISGTAYVYVGAADGRLYQIEADNPTAVKSVLLRTGTTIGAPAFDVFDNMVYVGSDAGVIYAVQAPIP